ncbi:MAG: threonylcarbamoyl-AMP synthase [Candidatus Marinimicrobia bacterium]|nr:threonylcarbamoyl-AMP synthase [Candidatus Neomarinimicrobiota bacterium]
MVRAEILNLSDTAALQPAVRRASDLLKEGGIIAYPTDTLYGLGVDPENIQAMEKLFKLKDRRKEKQISLMFSGSEMVKDYFAELTPIESRVINELLPGAITIIIETRERVKFGENNSVGVRIPDNEFCKMLTEQYGKPITTTSVNRSGVSPAKSVKEIIDYFPNEVDLILDGGRSPETEGSTVIQIIEEKLLILREGLIGEGEIRKKLYEN